MTLDYTKLQATASKLIRESGIRITLSRDDADVARSYGVVIGSGSKDYTAPFSSGITVTTQSQKTMLIAGDIKVPPAVGDLITSKLGTFHVDEVEVVQPSTTAIHFKVKVS